MLGKPDAVSETSPSRVQAEQMAHFLGGTIKPELLERFLAQCGRIEISENGASLYLSSGRNEEGVWVNMEWKPSQEGAKELNVAVRASKFSGTDYDSPTEFYFRSQGTFGYAGLEGKDRLGISLTRKRGEMEVITLVTNGSVLYEHYEAGKPITASVYVRV